MFRKRNPSAGAPPGTLVFRGEPTPARVQVVRYTKDTIDEVPVASIADVVGSIHHEEFVWIDVAGIDDPEMLRAGGNCFGLSDLTMENIVNVPQRPRTEMLKNKLLMITHVLNMDDKDALHIDQLSLVLGPNYVITVHAQTSCFLDVIRDRLRTNGSKLRARGTDFLAYAIMDAIVDGYYPVLESLGERLEILEQEALEQPKSELLRTIHQLRTQLIQVRRSSWPMRETLEQMVRSESPLISDETLPFLRDAQAHCAQIVDVVEMYRESAGALISTYMSSIAHRSNEIMKVLTMISSIFVPMTFVAGVYGMNFTHMPELSFRWAYPMALSVMGATAFVMLVFFYRKGWFGKFDLQVGSNILPTLPQQAGTGESPETAAMATVTAPDASERQRQSRKAA